MDDSSIIHLYAKVLQKEQNYFWVNEYDIRVAIQNMKEAYIANPDWAENEDSRSLFADYNDAAHRCAYLHKYAVCYTGMVQQLLEDILQNSPLIKRQLNSLQSLNLCSLGGGPGTDVVAILDFIANLLDFFPCSVKIIDLNGSWKRMFDSIVEELRNSCNVKLRNMLSPVYFRSHYITANLLLPLSVNVKQSIMSADFISMVKFISAAACAHTESMVAAIFRCLKPGAIVMFIDNAAGGFLQILQQQAMKHRLQTVYGPIEHYCYENSRYNIKRFGYNSQSKSTISLQIWMKPQTTYTTSQSLRHQYVSAQNQVYRDKSYNYTMHVNRLRQPPVQDPNCCCSLN